MKDKLLTIRTDDGFLERLDYLKQIYGMKSQSMVIRWIVDKEYRKETMKSDQPKSEE